MKNNPSPTLKLDEFLPYCLSNLSKRISNALAATYQSEFGIAIPEWRVIAILGGDKKLTSSEICQLSVMYKSKVSRAVKSLRGKGLLREQGDAQDGRTKHVFLSKKGISLYRNIVPKAQQWEASLLDILEAREYRDLMNIMKKLNRQLDDLRQIQ